MHFFQSNLKKWNYKLPSKIEMNLLKEIPEIENIQIAHLKRNGLLTVLMLVYILSNIYIRWQWQSVTGFYAHGSTKGDCLSCFHFAHARLTLPLALLHVICMSFECARACNGKVRTSCFSIVHFFFMVTKSSTGCWAV